MTITLQAAVELIREGNATYSGTTHTDKFGYAAIIERHDLSTVCHVSDVGPDDIAQLEQANAEAVA